MYNYPILGCSYTLTVRRYVPSVLFTILGLSYSLQEALSYTGGYKGGGCPYTLKEDPIPY